MGGYVVAHLKRDIVQLGEKVRRILFSKCICFYWFLVFLKFWIFGILNTYFSTTISVISDLVLLSFELRILNFGFFKSHCQPLNFGFFLWSWALKTRLEGSVFFAGGVLYVLIWSISQSLLDAKLLTINSETLSPDSVVSLNLKYYQYLLVSILAVCVVDANIFVYAGIRTSEQSSRLLAPFKRRRLRYFGQKQQWLHWSLTKY